MSESFSASLENSGKTAVIHMSGFFREHRIETFSKVFFQAGTEQPGLIELDLEQLLFVDSAALGCLLALCDRCLERGTGLRLVNVQPNLLEVLHQTRLIEVLDLGETVAGQTATEAEPAEVLVIDDKPLILNLVSAVLAKSGYAVRRAASGEQALELFQRHREKIGLILMDATLPDIQAAELIDQCAGVDATVPVVIMTGAGENVLEALDQNPTVAEILRKPFLNEALVALVRKWMSKC